MKKIILAMTMVLTTLTSCAQKEFSKDALNYELTALDGSKNSFQSIIEKHKGKKVVIEIWAGWCSDCVKAMPKVKEMQATNPNADFVFISMDKSMNKWKEAVEKHELKGDLYWVDDKKLMKGEFGKAIDLDWIPRYIVLNEEGQIVVYRAIETDFEIINKELSR